MFAYRTSKHASTNIDPFLMLYGRQARLPIEKALSTKINALYVDIDDYPTELQIKLTKAWEIASANINSSQAHQNRYYDRNVDLSSLHSGQSVLVRTPAITPGRSKKILHERHGSFVITRVQIPNLYVKETRKPNSPRQRYT